MDEAAVADVQAHMRDLRGCGVVAAKEDEVAGAQVLRAHDPLARARLRPGVPRNDDVMHEKDRADESAAVHSLGGHAGPDVRETVHSQGCGDDGVRGAGEAFPPLRLGFPEAFVEEAHAPVGEADAPVAALAAEGAEAVARHHVGDGGGLRRRPLEHRAGQCRHDDFRRRVPRVILLKGKQLDSVTMHPTGISVRRLHLRPVVLLGELEDMDRRAQEGLGDHFGVEVGSSAEIADGDVHHSVFLRGNRERGKGGRERCQPFSHKAKILNFSYLCGCKTNLYETIRRRNDSLPHPRHRPYHAAGHQHRHVRQRLHPGRESGGPAGIGGRLRAVGIDLLQNSLEGL